jgi:alpha-beta hydrolase superfamily lysophospholipase
MAWPTPSDRYAGFAERLVHAGYAVWAFDMRGHGRSAGVRVRIDRVDDLDAFVAVIRSLEPGRPIVLHGHSPGGLATALYAIERDPQVAGVVLAAPRHRVRRPADPGQRDPADRRARPRRAGARRAARPVLERPPGSVMSSLRILATAVRG